MCEPGVALFAPVRGRGVRRNRGTGTLGLVALCLWAGAAISPPLQSAFAAEPKATARAKGAAPRPVDETQLRSTMAALGREFKRFDTDRFVILSDADAGWTRSRATVLEVTARRFEDAMAQMGLRVAAPKNKLMCVLIKDHERFEAFAAAQDGVTARWIGGYYSIRTNRVAFFDPRTSPDYVNADDRLAEARKQAQRAEEGAERARRNGERDAAETYRMIARHVRSEIQDREASLGAQAARTSAAKTAHEAAHLLAFNQGLQMRSKSYPFWLSEGFATCFEPATEEDARKGRFGPDVAVPRRDQDLARARAEGRTLPLSVLVTVDAPPDHDAEAAGAMYAQAHSLFRFLFEQDPKAMGGMFLDLSREETPPSPQRLLTLFEARFGAIDQVERRWLNWAGPAGAVATVATDE